MKVIALISLLALTAYSVPDGSGYQVGDYVTDFNLIGTDDQMHSLSSIDNALGYFVIFTCNTCPFAVDNEDRIMALHAQYGPLGFPVVAINSNDPDRVPGDSFEAMKQRAADKGFEHLYLFDETQEVAQAFGASRTPQVYLLLKSTSGTAVKYIGAIDDSPRQPGNVTQTYAADAVDALMDGNDPDPNFIKAIGCSIKWAL